MATSLKLPAALWPHQKGAIKAIHAFLSDPGADGTAALLTLPTGTGKSGVIAWSLAQLPELKGHRLVLTPWAALRDQLIEDIDGRFWKRLGMDSPPKKMPLVKRLPATKDIDTVADGEPTIYVATISAISTLWNQLDGSAEIAAKFAAFDCVVVDEGHYEPAEKWSQAIRALNLPTVLLTATPYRNDLKFFTIGEHRYRLPHHEAEAERFLRRPEFSIIDTADPTEFASQLRQRVEEEFGEDAVRVIVRCKDAPAIRTMVSALQNLGESALGIHENFTREDGADLVTRVPPRDDSGAARFWVHQNKLIEGIDDPQFKVVALFNSLRNGRAIVQQVGRVLRNPIRDEGDMKALVIGRGDRDLQQVWSGYTAFDRDETGDSAATMPELIARLVENQPKSFYFDRDYRVQIDLTSLTAWKTFSYPLRTRVFRVRKGEPPALDALAEETKEAWEGLDRTVYVVQQPDERTVVIPYLSAENSPLLRTATFVEPQFGYTSLRVSGDLVFVYDARGRIPPPVLLACDPLSPSELTRLFPAGSSGLTSVSLSNTDTGRQAARRRQLSAAAIEDLAPDLADYGYVCTVAVGHVREGELRPRRYLGLSRSRLTDYRSSEGDYESFSQWLDQVEADVRGGQSALSTFGRYAAYAPVPADPSPVHVLLDINPSDFVRRGEEADKPLDLEDTAHEVKDGMFRVTIEGVEYPVAIKWDGRGYRLSSTIPQLEYVEAIPDGRELIHAINEDQLLRVVPAESGVIYSHGQFVAPRGIKATAGILSLLTPIQRLSTIATEKGGTSTDDDWDANSIFGLISALSQTTPRAAEAELAVLLGSPDLLICTDLGTEIADFIAVKETRVALIHAKASSSRRLASATALHGVISQALKNLPYLQPFEEIAPPTGHWGNRWKAKDGGTINRRRVGDYKTSADAWKQIRAVIANPQADREVWLVMGQSLSVAKLKTELAKRAKPPEPEVLQIFSLLQTAWAATSQMGAKLRVFCSE